MRLYTVRLELYFVPTCACDCHNPVFPLPFWLVVLVLLAECCLSHCITINERKSGRHCMLLTYSACIHISEYVPLNLPYARSLTRYSVMLKRQPDVSPYLATQLITPLNPAVPVAACVALIMYGLPYSSKVCVGVYSSLIHSQSPR